MKYCKKCGTQLEDDSLFCSKCGTKQELIEEEQPLQPVTKQKVETTKKTIKFKEFESGMSVKDKLAVTSQNVDALDFGPFIASFEKQIDVFCAKPSLLSFEYIELFLKIFDKKINDIEDASLKEKIRTNSGMIFQLIPSLKLIVNSTPSGDVLNSNFAPIKTQLSFVSGFIPEYRSYEEDELVWFNPDDYSKVVIGHTAGYWLAMAHYSKVLIIVFAVIFGAVLGVLPIFFGLAIFGIPILVVTVGATIYICLTLDKAYKNSKCKKCNTIVDSSRDIIDIRIISEVDKANNYGTTDTKVKLSVTVKCPKCGETYTVNASGYTVKHYYNVNQTSKVATLKEIRRTSVKEIARTAFIDFQIKGDESSQGVIEKFINKTLDKWAVKKEAYYNNELKGKQVSKDKVVATSNTNSTTAVQQNKKLVWYKNKKIVLIIVLAWLSGVALLILFTKLLSM